MKKSKKKNKKGIRNYTPDAKEPKNRSEERKRKNGQLWLDKKGYLRLPYGTLYHHKVYKDNYGDWNPEWHIHHIDGDRYNNDPKNLIALPSAMHGTIHQLKKLPDRQTIEIWLERWLKNGKRLDKKKLKEEEKKKCIEKKVILRKNIN